MRRRSKLKRRHEEADVAKTKFERWNEFPAELKTKILRNLQFPDLRKVTFLSKEFMHIAANIRPKVDISVRAVDRNDPVECTTVVVSICSTNGERFGSPWSYQIYFDNDENGGSVAYKYRKKTERQCTGKKILFHYNNETCECSALRVLLHLMKFVKAELISLDFNPAPQELKRILNEKPRLMLECEAFITSVKKRASFSLLTRLLAPGCELELPCGVFLDKAFFSSGLPRTAPAIQCCELPNVTDEQLLLIFAPEMHIGVPRVTSKGVNGLIKQWLNGDRQITRVVLRNTEYLDVSSVRKGLDPSVILSPAEVMKKLDMEESEESELTLDEITFGVCNASNICLVVFLNDSRCICSTHVCK